MTTAPDPREAADRVEKWLEQWRPDRHQTYSLASTDLQVLIAAGRSVPADGAADAAEVGLGAPGVLWMAMRYALGRRTYAVSEACDAIRENLGRLNQWQAQSMAREIDQHLEWCAAAGHESGMTTHWASDLEEQWRTTAVALRERVKDAQA